MPAKFNDLLQLGHFVPVGSRVTCSPAPTDTDEDWLVLTPDPWKFRNEALLNGYNIGGSLILDASSPLDGNDRFSSYTKGEVNLIATYDEVFFKKFLAATSVAKRLNLLEKDDRIALFQAVLYSAACD